MSYTRQSFPLISVPQKSTWLRRVKLQKRQYYISIYDSFCEELIHVICQLILFLVFCHLKTCLACVSDDVVFLSLLPLSELGPNFSQFEPIFFPEEESIVLVICSSVWLPLFSFFLPYYVRLQLDLPQNKLIGVSQCSSYTYKWSQDLFISSQEQATCKWFSKSKKTS